MVALIQSAHSQLDSLLQLVKSHANMAAGSRSNRQALPRVKPS